MEKNKKGQEFSITTLVVIVLAIIVLVVLALGFGAGWSNLWSKMTGYFSPVNVDSVKQACTFACTTQAKYDYCCRIREVKFTKEQEKPQELTCKDIPGLSCSDIASCDGQCQKSIICDITKNMEIKDKTKNEECGDKFIEDKNRRLNIDLSALGRDKICCIGKEQ